MQDYVRWVRCEKLQILQHLPHLSKLWSLLRPVSSDLSNRMDGIRNWTKVNFFSNSSYYLCVLFLVTEKCIILNLLWISTMEKCKDTQNVRATQSCRSMPLLPHLHSCHGQPCLLPPCKDYFESLKRIQTRLIPFFFFFTFIWLFCVHTYTRVYMCVGTQTVTRVEVREQLQELVLSYHHVGSRDWTQVVRLDG